MTNIIETKKGKWTGILAAVVLVALIETQLLLIFKFSKENLNKANITSSQLAMIKQKTEETEQNFKNNEKYLKSLEKTVKFDIARLAKNLNLSMDGLMDTRRKISSIEEYSKKTLYITVGNLKKLDEIDRKSFPDSSIMSKKMMSPSVQINSGNGIGAGVIVYSQPDKSGIFHTYILTAYHVVSGSVKKIAGTEKREKVSVITFGDAGDANYFADIVTYSETKDIALLKLSGPNQFKNVCELLPKDSYEKVKIFSKVFAVGCPLGNQPLPTSGELTSKTKNINGEDFWMVNAPTIYGNSGGGIFTADTYQLIGISSMIAIYENVVSIPVPHLGIMVPPPLIYDMLDSQNYQFVYDKNMSKEDCEAKRNEQRKTNPELVKITWEK